MKVYVYGFVWMTCCIIASIGFFIGLRFLLTPILTHLEYMTLVEICKGLIYLLISFCFYSCKDFLKNKAGLGKKEK